MIAVEKHIPLPPQSKGHKYPFDEMEIGDSFFVPAIDINGSLSGSLKYWSAKLGRSFTRRKQSDGVRVWRTA